MIPTTAAPPLRKRWIPARLAALFSASLLAAVFVLAAPLPAAAQPEAQPSQPSFDCGKITTRIETAICADWYLGDLDSGMADRYRSVLAIRGIDRAAVQADQRRWLKERRSSCPTGYNQCAKALEAAYLQRIGELEEIMRQYGVRIPR